MPFYLSKFIVFQVGPLSSLNIPLLTLKDGEEFALSPVLSAALLLLHFVCPWDVVQVALAQDAFCKDGVVV